MLKKLEFLPLFLLLIFASCNNLFENPSEKNHNTSERKYITVTGSLKLDGAFPAEFIQMYQRQAELESSDTSRTAFPTIPASGITYVIKAINTTNSNDYYSGIPSSDYSSYTVGIPASETAKTYKIHISVILSGFESEYVLLSGESSEFTISSTTPVVTNLDINLTANGSDGRGIINLSIDVSGSGINSAVATYKSGNVTTTMNATKSGDILTFKDGVHTDDELEDGFPTGSWAITFNFYTTADRTGEIVYSFTEIVNIFENLTTNTWVQNGNEPWFFTTTDAGGNKSTTCRITAAMVDGYALKDIYVDSTRNTTNPSDSTYTTQSGTFINPVTSFNAALAMLHDAGKDYTIYINGTLTGLQNLSSTNLSKTAGDGKAYHAKSLTICGANGLDGIPQDSLNGNGSGPVLSILTDVPVTIKNLKIYGGSTTGNGGGIYISSSNASVTLTDGAVITGNQAACGGGVFVDNGSLFVYGSAVVGKSGVSTHAGTTSGSYGNKATTSGGGIGVGTGTLWLGYCGENIPAETSGGVIYNLVIGAAETHGGGIDNQSGTVNIARGNVSYNYACCSSGSTATGCGGGISTARIVNLTGTAVIEKNYSSYGGGVYITRDTYNGHFVMTGGTIQLNHANKEHPGTGESWGDGGGVAIGSNASFTISGGTISSNYAERCGGAVVDHFGTAFNIKGSAYIPYDSVHSCNDVYIASGKTIALSESLSPPEACTDSDGIIAQITPSAYTEATPVFTISAPATSAELSHFKVTPNGTQDWGINTEGKLREGVVLPDSFSEMDSGKTYFVSDSSGIAKIAEFSSSGCNFSGVKLKLESNVTIDTAWTPIGNSTAFSGTFDGNGKTVTFAAESNAAAFLGTVNGTVKNLKVTGSTNVSGIAKKATSSAVIENCENSAEVTSSTTQSYCAGIVAEVDGATIKGCVNKGTVISNYVVTSNQGSSLKGAGGITGPVQNGGIIDSCANEGNVTGPGAGGITSFLDAFCVIRNARNSGNVTSTKLDVGGIVGVAVGNGNDLTQACHIDNCFNSGSVTASGTTDAVLAGGIAGELGGGNIACAKNCLNIGSVSISESAPSESKVGALFGTKWNSSTVDFCYYKEGCAGTAKGVGGSSLDTRNQCIKATQTGQNDAVNSVELTLNGTTYSADTGTVLSLLNAWVSANNEDGLYLVWESDTNHWPKLKTE